MDFKLGIIGCGKMGSALVEGIVRSKQLRSSEIALYDVVTKAAEALGEKNNLALLSSEEEIFSQCERILLAVKPEDISNVGAKVKTLHSQPLIISIAAGVTLEQLQQSFPHARAIRVMPNTPALIGKGATAYAASEEATEKDIQFTRKLFDAVGRVVHISENSLDAITGLSGSGPAYVYTFIEALADGAVAEGISRELAIQFAAQTVSGAAEMVLSTGTHPAVLRDRVTSPGGTTAAGLAALEEGALRAIVAHAVRAAAQRSRELSDK